MHFDILIFAVVALFLVLRLRAALGTRNEGETPLQNPFAGLEEKPKVEIIPPPSRPHPPADIPSAVIDVDADKEGQVKEGLAEIAARDAQFNVTDFMGGARYAFEMIVKSYNDGDRGTLKSLLSPKLCADFEAGIEAREKRGLKPDVSIRRIVDARIVKAHLGGVMAYVTVSYKVDQTSVTRNVSGAVVEGDAERVMQVNDIWTFSRDIRSVDPNWTLIETRTLDL